MKRGLQVAALVLVPFAALVLLGFHFSAPEEASVRRDEGETRLAPPEPARAPEAVIAAPVKTTRPEQAAPSPLLAPYTPLLRQCFTDNQARGEVRLRFTPQRDGGFGAIVVDQNSTQNPYVAACVEDVLDGAAFTPSPGPDYAPIDFTFSF